MLMNMMLDLENLNHWRDLPLSNPKGKLRVGTLFSGIGAIEQRERETSQHQQTAERFTYQTIREIQNEINPIYDNGIDL